MFDVVVIGGGVVGGLVFRELTKFTKNVCLLEKENDVALGASRANSGIVHAGFDAKVGSKKAKFNVQGAELMPSVCKELGVKYRQNGSLVVGFSDGDEKHLNELYERGLQNGVKELKIVKGEELFALEPNLPQNATCALFAPTAGIVCPYGLTIAAVGNAMDNGGTLKTDFKVSSVRKTDDRYEIISENKESVFAKYVVISAGAYADKVASLFGDDSFTVGVRKGEYILLDRTSGNAFNSTIFSCPTEKGKGILVSPTVDGNLILGPTAVEQDDRDDVSTSADGLLAVTEGAKRLYDKVNLGASITSFSGLRAYSDGHDFIIEESNVAKNVFLLGGIESPGLTSSPAIAVFVSDFVAKKLGLTAREDFNPIRKSMHFFKDLSVEEKNEIIKKNPAYGTIVCRCEEITLGEILDAASMNPKATTVDGIKRRTRAGMGRCQGGFCQPSVLKVLAEKLGVPYTEIEKDRKGSNLLLKRTKGEDDEKR